MNIIINIDKNKIENVQPKIYNIGTVTTTLQDLLDSTTIIITNYRPIVLEYEDLDTNIVRAFLNLKDYTIGSQYGFGKDITENDLIPLGSGSGGSQDLQSVLDIGNYALYGNINLENDLIQTTSQLNASSLTFIDDTNDTVCQYTANNYSFSKNGIPTTVSSEIPSQSNDIKFPNDSGILKISKYNVYAALFSQSGISNPSVTIFENSLNISGSWVRLSAGNYKLDTTIPYDVNKIYLPGFGLRQAIVFVDGVGSITGQGLLYFINNGGTVSFFFQVTSGGVLVDLSTISPTPSVHLPEIRIYN